MRSDHPLMRAALAAALAPLAPHVEFVEATNDAETLALLDQSPAPDLLLMDLHMPGARGRGQSRGSLLQATRGSAWSALR